MNSLLTLALTHTTTLNDTYNEATQLARAATMERGGYVLHDYYTFEEYIARRGNFIHKLPEYKHLHNACWVVRKNTANLIFNHEQQQLGVREVRRRELEMQVEPLLPLPTTANTESIDGFATCRPEGGWDVKTPGGSERFYSPATSPVQGDLTVEASIAAPDAQPSIADPEESAELLLQIGSTPARSLRSDVRDVHRSALIEHPTILPGITVTNDDHLITTQQDIGVEGVDRLKLPAYNRVKTPTQSSTGLNIIHDNAIMSHTKTPTGDEAQASPAASLPESSIRPTQWFKPNGKEPSTKQSEAESTTSQDGALESSSAKEKTFTLHPGVSSMARYGIVAPVKNKEVFKNKEESALKPATSAATMATKKEDIENVEQSTLKPAPPATTMAAPTAPIEAVPTKDVPLKAVPIEAAPDRASLLEASTDAAIPAQKPDISQEFIEPAPKRQKLTRGVAQPVVKTPTSTAAKTKTPLTKATPTTIKTTDSPFAAAAPSKEARRIASIIAGTSLPKTKAEARAAATEHHSLLLAAHNASQPPAQRDPNRRTSTRNLAKPTDPDLMPFFFSRPQSDIKQGGEQQQQQDFIRCICGVQHDDGNNMICCETCEVWQHSACVVPGLAQDKLEALRWECAVCDPWGNREVLRGLRMKVKAGVMEGGSKRRASAAP